MKNEEIVIIDGVTLTSLNPKNYALKNTYLSNILTTAFKTLPKVYEAVKEPLKVLRCFMSASYVNANFSYAKRAVLRRFTKGMSIEVTWDNWDADEALRAAYMVYEVFDEDVNDNAEVILDLDRKTLIVHRDTKETTLKEKTLEELRSIR